LSEEPDQFEKTSLIPDLPTGSDTPSTREPDVLKSVHTEGAPEFVNGLQALLDEFRDRFARSVNKDPARVPPMELEVDAEKLKSARLSGRARPLSEVKLATLRQMLGEL
jgi:hypothetical protein